MRVNGTGKEIKVPSRIGDVGATDGTCEQRVTDEDMIGTFLYGEKKATTAEGVSGGVQNLQFN